MSVTQTPEFSSASAYQRLSLQYPATRAPASQNSPAQAQSTPPEPRCQYSQTHTRSVAAFGLRNNRKEIPPCTSPNPRPPGNRSYSLCRRGIGRASLLPHRFAIHPAQLRLWSSPRADVRVRGLSVPLRESHESLDTSLHPRNAGIFPLQHNAGWRGQGCGDLGETESGSAAATDGSPLPAADFHPAGTAQPACQDSSSNRDPRST